jgi:hypothetical protein
MGEKETWTTKVDKYAEDGDNVFTLPRNLDLDKPVQVYWANNPNDLWNTPPEVERKVLKAVEELPKSGELGTPTMITVDKSRTPAVLRLYPRQGAMCRIVIVGEKIEKMP